MNANKITEVKVTDIKIGSRFRKEMGDLDELAKSINGGDLLQPIGITPDNELVFGERRLRAYRDVLQRDTIPARIVDVKSVVLGQIAENTVRKEFTISERIAIVDALCSFEHGGDRKSDQARNCKLDSLTLGAACKLVGFSEDSYRRAKEVEQKGVPDLVQAMDAGKLSIHASQKLAQALADVQLECLARGFNEQHATAKAISRLVRQAELDRQQTSYHHASCTASFHDSKRQIDIWCGDCMTLMRDRIMPGTVDVVVTSIPYNIGIPYATYDDSRPEMEYLTWLGQVFGAIKDVLKDDGSFFLNVGATHLKPWTAMRVAEVAGRYFVLQNEIIWVKAITVAGTSHGHFRPLNGHRFLNHNWEQVFHFTKTGAVKMDRLAVGVPYEDTNNLRRNRAEHNLRCSGDVWLIPHETTKDRGDKGFHPCVFPVELPERCIRLHGLKPNTLALDPFNGTGSSTVAFSRLGVKGIGIDLDPGYCRFAESRVADHRCTTVIMPMVGTEPIAQNTVVQGDCRDLIPRLADNSIGLCVTSPPYAEQRKGLYPGVPEAEYPAFTVGWMGQLWDKLISNGSVLIVIDPHVEKGVMSDYVLRTQLALREWGWKQHMPSIWHKDDRCPLGHTGWLRHTYEQILWFSKTERPYCDPKVCGKEGDVLSPKYRHSRWSPGGKPPVKGVKRATDVISIPVGGTPKGVDHPAMFPVELPEFLIRTFCRPGGTVLDCFSGSGNTLIAASRLGHPFVGFDLVSKYVALANKRLAEAVNSRPMPKAG